jgi:hypothetical protein
MLSLKKERKIRRRVRDQKIRRKENVIIIVRKAISRQIAI